MITEINLLKLIPLCVSACCLINCANYTYDSPLYVAGKVTDQYGEGIANVEVNLNSLKTVTNNHGCFIYIGIYPSKPIQITFINSSYKPILKNLPFDGYFIEVELTEINSTNDGKFTFKKLDLSNPNLHVECE